MTEQEYINVRDLSNVIHAADALRGVCIENQPHIDREEFLTVTRHLSKWRENLFEQVRASTSGAAEQPAITGRL